jgi:hypothetical protein
MAKTMPVYEHIKKILRNITRPQGGVTTEALMAVNMKIMVEESSTLKMEGES